jgi:uncharacterized iron-regulated protein
MAKKFTVYSAVLTLTVFCAGAARPESALSLLKNSCDGLKAAAPVPPGSGVPSPSDGPGLCIFSSASGLPLSGQKEFAGTLEKADVVYVGETHDRLNDHLAQLEALKALVRRRIDLFPSKGSFAPTGQMSGPVSAGALGSFRGGKIAVGFEMLNSTLQPVLDDYAAGRITQEEFLTRTDWAKEWGFDFALYKPIFDFLIQNKLRALALNVPRKVISKIARSGIAGLTPEERAFLPETVAITGHKEYLAYLKESYDAMHGAKPMPAITWENYLASMCAWNEGMGSRIAGFMNANPGWAVMTIAGNGHVMYNAAIPASVASRTEGVRQVSFYTEGSPQCPASLPASLPGRADYIWLNGDRRLFPGLE